MEYNNYSNNFNYQNDYYYQLKAAKKRERKALSRNVTKLAVLLLAYNILSSVFLSVYYYMVYAYFNHEITLDYNRVMVYLSGQQELINSSLFSMLGNLFVVFFSLVITMLIAVCAMNIDLTELLSPRKGQIKQGAKWFPVCMTVNLFVSVLVSIFTLVMEEAGVTVPDVDFSVTQNNWLTVTTQVAYVIIIGPIAEELIYRGLILTLLKPFGKWMAVFFSALIFGLMHGNIPQAVPAFAGAIIYGLVAIHCNSIIPTILIHIANNALASYSDFADIFSWPEEIYSVCMIAVVLAGIYIFMTNYYKLKITDEVRGALSSGGKYMAVIFNPAMIIYFLMNLITFISWFVMENM